MRGPQGQTLVGTAAVAAAMKAGGKGRSRDGKVSAGKLAHRYLWTPIEDEVLIIYVKLLRPGDYDGTPIASDKQVAWDRVAESFNDEFKMWKKQYPSINLTVNTRDGKSCRSRWKYHVSLMRTKRGEKIPMTASEDEYIIYMQQKLSNKWSLISAELTARFGVYRTDNDVKNRWNSKLQHIVRKRRLDGIPPLTSPPPVPAEPIAENIDCTGPDSRPAVESKLDTLKPSKAPSSATKWPSAGRLEQLLDVPHVILRRLKDLRNSTAGSALPQAPAPAKVEAHKYQQVDYSTSSSGDGVEDSLNTASLSCAQSLMEDVPAHVKELLKTAGGLMGSSATFLDVHNSSSAMHRAHSLPGNELFTHCNNTSILSTGHVEDWEGLESTRGSLQRTSSAHPRSMAALCSGGPSSSSGGLSNVSLQRAIDMMLKKVEDGGQLGSLSRLSSNSPFADAGTGAAAAAGPSARGMSRLAHSSGIKHEVFDHAEQSLTGEVQQLLANQNDLMAQLGPGLKKHQSPGGGVGAPTDADLQVDEILAEVDSLMGSHAFGASPGGLNMNIKPEPELDTLLGVDHMDFNVDCFWT
eukprot:jgi/Tetstr1/441859/TSEL_030070.t1